MSDTKPKTFREQYQQNLLNIKSFMEAPLPEIKKGTRNDPSKEEWESMLTLHKGMYLLCEAGLKLKKEIENGNR